MNIRQALNDRIPRVRKVRWANPDAYIRLPLFPDDMHGPWAELYEDRVQTEILGVRPGSQRLCVLLPDVLDDDGYEAYTGSASMWEGDAENYARLYVEG